MIKNKLYYYQKLNNETQSIEIQKNNFCNTDNSEAATSCSI